MVPYGSYGPVQSHMTPHGPVWPLMALYGSVCPHMALYGPIWPHLAQYYPVSPRIAPHGSVRPNIKYGLYGPYGPALYGPLRPGMAPYGPVWPHMAPYSPVLSCMVSVAMQSLKWLCRSPFVSICNICLPLLNSRNFCTNFVLVFIHPVCYQFYYIFS